MGFHTSARVEPSTCYNRRKIDEVMLLLGELRKLSIELLTYILHEIRQPRFVPNYSTQFVGVIKEGITMNIARMPIRIFVSPNTASSTIIGITPPLDVRPIIGGHGSLLREVGKRSQKTHASFQAGGNATRFFSVAKH